MELAAFGVVPLRMAVWQLLYRTSDLNGTAEAAVTTVLLPRDCAPGRPLVSFHCAIDAVAPQCFPSYALRRGARAIGAIPQLELPLIAAALDRGWVVRWEWPVGRSRRETEEGERGWSWRQTPIASYQ